MTGIEIQRMQDSLQTIREAAGLTKEGLAERAGIEKEAIEDAESGKGKLSETQYLALRKIFKLDILDAYIDHPDKYTDEERNSILHNRGPVIREEEEEKKVYYTDLDRTLDFVDIATDFAPGAVGVITGLLGSWLVKLVRKASGKDGKKKE